MSPRTPSIENYIICISGFLQNHGQVTGVVKLWNQLRREFENPKKTRVERCFWNDDMRALAESICCLKPNSAKNMPKVLIIGYSWGGGRGAVWLARELLSRGINVEHMILSDPVYRSLWCVMRWRSLIPPRKCRRVATGKLDWIQLQLSRLAYRLGRLFPFLVPKIAIPRNVQRVTSFRQSLGVPMAHRLVTESPATRVFGPMQHDVSHAQMDDHPHFHRICKALAEEMLCGPR